MTDPSIDDIPRTHLTWLPVLNAFPGGAREASELLGRRIRTRSVLRQVVVYDPDPSNPTQELVELPLQADGFVMDVVGGRVLLAFRRDTIKPLINLTLLIRSRDYFVVDFPWVRFRMEFMIEL